MKLYKFKSLENFQFVSDILCHGRFFASKFFDLNDPMEGRFDHDPQTKKEFLEEIARGKERLRVCAFSKNFGSLLLWAHYADSFKGICIEVEAEETDDSRLVEVNYSEFNVYVSNASKDKLETLPETILGCKNRAWKYEREVRILSRNEYVKRGIKVKGIYLGLRTPEVVKRAIARIVAPEVPVFETEICRSTNKIKKGARYSTMI